MRRPVVAFALFFTVPLAAQTKPLITPKDYGKWEVLGGPRLSPKGDWVAVAVNRVDEENELRIRGGPRDTTIVVKYGTGVVYSADGKWIAYSTGPSPARREQLTKDKKPIRYNVEARNLATGKVLAVSEIRHYGATSLQVDRRLRAMLEHLIETLPEPRRPALRQELELLGSAVRRGFQDEQDRLLAAVGDCQGVGGSDR